MLTTRKSSELTITQSTPNNSYRINSKIPRRTTRLNYNLNPERAIVKKLNTCDRPTQMIEKAGGNFFIELSTVGFEAFREVMLMYIQCTPAHCP